MIPAVEISVCQFTQDIFEAAWWLPLRFVALASRAHVLRPVNQRSQAKSGSQFVPLVRREQEPWTRLRGIDRLSNEDDRASLIQCNR